MIGHPPWCLCRACFIEWMAARGKGIAPPDSWARDNAPCIPLITLDLPVEPSGPPHSAGKWK